MPARGDRGEPCPALRHPSANPFRCYSVLRYMYWSIRTRPAQLCGWESQFISWFSPPPLPLAHPPPSPGIVAAICAVSLLKNLLLPGVAVQLSNGAPQHANLRAAHPLALNDPPLFLSRVSRGTSSRSMRAALDVKDGTLEENK